MLGTCLLFFLFLCQSGTFGLMVLKEKHNMNSFSVAQNVNMDLNGKSKCTSMTIIIICFIGCSYFAI